MQHLTKEQRERWATALESGEFKQGAGVLHYKDEYCCLGVLREVCPERFVFEGKVDDNNKQHVYKFAAFIETELNINFVNLNDVKNKSFKEIAEIVRTLPTSD